MIRKSIGVLGAALTLASATTVNAQRQQLTADHPLGPQIVSLNASGITGDEGSLAATVTCAKLVLPNDNFVSTQGRIPNPRFANCRSVYLIRASELAAAGYTSGSIPTAIGWSVQTAYNQTGSCTLRIYLENTTDTTNTKPTSFATCISTMTKVHDATTSLPSAVGAYDVTFSGGSPFTYTGGGLYVAFDQIGYAGTLATAGQCWVNGAGLTGGGYTVNSNSDTLALTNSRAETRLNGDPNPANDTGVTYVYAMGALPFCTMPGTQIIKANVRNNGSNAQASVPVTLNVTGADTFTDTQNALAVASCGGTASVTFLAYAPSASAGDDIITVSVPADDNNANNSLSRTFSKTTNEANYKNPGTTATGGVGVNGVMGAFVAKFDTPVANTITDVKIEFPLTPPATPNQTYKVAIYGDSGSGTPSTTPIFVEATDHLVTATGPVTITLTPPVAVGPGTFYVGIQQTSINNVSLGYVAESPIRAATFYFSAALPVVTWNDFAPANVFKLNVGIVLGTACSVAPPCPADITGDHSVGVADLLAVIGAWGPCPAPPTPCPADINADTTVGVSDLLTVIGAWGPCP